MGNGPPLPNLPGAWREAERVARRIDAYRLGSSSPAIAFARIAPLLARRRVGTTSRVGCSVRCALDLAGDLSERQTIGA